MQIKVSRIDEDSADHVYGVGLDRHVYKVTFSDDYYHELTGGKASADELVRRSFEFLLEREGAESIMGQFELPVIKRYFPEYEDEMRRIFSLKS